MIDILQRCNFLYTNLMDCEDKHSNEIKENDCYKCTKNNYQHLNNDHYDCLKKLCVYTMFYGTQYVNEIYTFLKTSNFLNQFIQDRRQISICSQTYTMDTSSSDIPVFFNVLSLGCGFGPDDIALSKYKDDFLDANVIFNYYGYDKEPLWNYITQTNSKPITYDILQGLSFLGFDIVFINKLFSTLKKNRLSSTFLEILRNNLNSLPIGSYIIYNDINHPNEGRDEFNDFLIENNFECIAKYYIDGYTGDYIKLELENICQVPDELSITPRNYDIKTIIFLYKKVQ